ncbi:MAG: hypothetical protein LCH69_11360 [Proteobacteria bacterium]|nr:hypothetical protein [Pseudomonadota bacterium]
MATSLRILSAVIAAAVFVMLGRHMSVALDGMVSAATGPSPYFIAGQAAFLYLWVPFVALCATALFLAPGLTLALGLATLHDRFETWLLKGFALSVFGVSSVAALVHATTGLDMTGGGFIVLLVILCLPGAWIVAARGGGSEGGAMLLRGRFWDITLMIVLPAAVLVLMSPKFYWENFNDDGAHSFLGALLFIHRDLPLWPPGDTGLIGYPSTTMMTETFVQTAFVRFFGPYESALRFAYLPGISVLAGVLLGLARRPGEATRGSVATGIGAQLLLFSFVMAFNPSYNPYFADVALPMTREPLIIVGFIGGVIFFLERRYFWMAVVGCLGLLSAPNALLLLMFFFASYLLLTRPLPLRQVIVGGAVTIAVVMLATLAMMVLDKTGVAQSGTEFGSDSILRRLRFITLFDFQRMLFWLLPAGILPGLALLAWRWQDHLSRCLTLTAVVYVLFFYVQAYRILPHHFSPAAILPIIVFWRLRPVAAAPVAALAAGLGGVAVAAWIAWPDTLAPNLENRAFGERLALVEPIDPFTDPTAFGTYSALMNAGFETPWNDAAVQEFYAPELTAAFVYATRPKPEGYAPDYMIQSEGHPLPAGAVVLGAAVNGLVLVVRDPAIVTQDRTAEGRPVSIARAFQVRRESIFGQGLRDKSRTIWDLAQIAGLR